MDSVEALGDLLMVCVECRLSTVEDDGGLDFIVHSPSSTLSRVAVTNDRPPPVVAISDCIHLLFNIQRP